MKFHFSVGNDIGNSEHAIYVDGNLIRQPNVYSLIGQIPWSDDDIDVQKNVQNIYDNLVVSIVSNGIPTGLYTVGNHALKTNGENVTSLYVKGNNSKSDQLVPYINTLAAIAGCAVSTAHKQGDLPEEIEVRVDMATALPVKQHTPANVKKMQEKFMNGNHLISVHLGVSKKVNVKIKFDYVHILQEGTPPIFALQMNSNGDWRTSTYDADSESSDNESLFGDFSDTYELGPIDGSYFDGKNILHLDGGDGTTDSPFTRGDAVDKDFCDGVNHGIGHAIDPAITDLLNLAPHAFNSLSRQQFSEILKSQFSNRKHKFLNEALQAFRPHCENQVAQILTLARNQILKIGSNEIDIIAVYGGGSILMRGQLYEQLKTLADSVRIQLFYVPAKYAVTLNAEGLDFFVKSPIFAQLKKLAKAEMAKKREASSAINEAAATNE